MDDRLSWDGTCFSMPERAVLPKPLQKPHPPMWVTVTSPGTELDAADRGLGCLGVAAVSYAEQERRTREYHRRVRQCEPVGGMVNDRVATNNFLYCHEDTGTAVRDGMRFMGMFGLLNSHLLFTREAYPTNAYQTLGNLNPAPRSESGGPGDEVRAPEGICVGDPRQITEAARRWESIGVDQINFILNVSNVLSQEQVLDEPAPVRARGDAGFLVGAARGGGRARLRCCREARDRRRSDAARRPFRTSPPRPRRWRTCRRSRSSASSRAASPRRCCRRRCIPRCPAWSDSRCSAWARARGVRSRWRRRGSSAGAACARAAS